MLCNLADMEDIKRFCNEFRDKYSKLDILVCNAGVITLDRRETKDELELQFGVNHIGHFLLTTSLLPLIQTAGNARIVVVGSGAHKIGKIDFNNIPLRKGYSVFSAYGRSVKRLYHEKPPWYKKCRFTTAYKYLITESNLYFQLTDKFIK